ncbi:MAG: exosome complex protein Rrp42 [Thermoplasmatota archaeon]
MSEPNSIACIKRDYLYRLAKEGKRPDGRKANEYRPIEIEADFIDMAEGSAKVRIGNTLVVAGVKIMEGEPYPDKPDAGAIVTMVELNPLASPVFEHGPPRERATELARVVDRGIRESNTIALEELCIESGEKAWIVFIDIDVLDYDGNLFDACSFAASVALQTAVIPLERYDRGENVPLPVDDPPVSCTWVKYNDTLVVDPSLDEDEVADARLTVAVDKNGDIRAMQKGLSGSFTADEVKKTIKETISLAPELRKKLEESYGKKD